MITEDEKWRENFTSNRGANDGREGYKPYNRDNNNRSYGRGGYAQRSEYNNGERASHYQRPRPFNSEGDSAQRSYRPRYNAEGGEGRPSYNRYESRGNGHERTGGYRQEGGYRREGGYAPRQEGGYRQDFNRNREGGFNRGGYRQEGQGGRFQQGERFGNRPQFKKRTSDYDPNAKYSMKKRIEYREQNLDPDAPIRLNKFLANAGVCSRREADEYIEAGVVTVNGQVVTELGTKVKRSDEVKFHDQPINIEKKVYVLLNKPKDYVTTSDDPQNRKTVMDLVRNACRERIYPVGRLDRNTTGVLLLTNDGDMASRLTHPQFLKKKIYHVYTDKNVTAADMRQIAEGITLEDGEIHADAIEYASDTDKKQVGIEIHSGRNRIVRRIFESLGYRVMKLDRVYFAGLTKKNVRRGDWRFLTEKEVEMLRMGAFE